MITPEKLRREAETADALMDAFEEEYIDVMELSKGHKEKKEQAVTALYELRDLLHKVILDMNELSGHMEVCNAVWASVKARKGENAK